MLLQRAQVDPHPRRGHADAADAASAKIEYRRRGAMDAGDVFLVVEGDAGAANIRQRRQQPGARRERGGVKGVSARRPTSARCSSGSRNAAITLPTAVQCTGTALADRRVEAQRIVALDLVDVDDAVAAQRREVDRFVRRAVELAIGAGRRACAGPCAPRCGSRARADAGRGGSRRRRGDSSRSSPCRPARPAAGAACHAAGRSSSAGR